MNLTLIAANNAQIIEAMDVAMQLDHEVCAFWVLEGDGDQHAILLGQVIRIRDQ